MNETVQARRQHASGGSGAVRRWQTICRSTGKGRDTILASNLHEDRNQECADATALKIVMHRDGYLSIVAGGIPKVAGVRCRPQRILPENAASSNP